jgi:hypothetical protein
MGMLDFAEDLRDKINARLESARAQLEGSGDPAKPRGKVEALREVLIDLDDLITQYAKPESVPEHLQDRKPRRVYGGRAA